MLMDATLVMGPSNASAFTFNADGTFSYTPTAGFTGTDSFTYQLNDDFAFGTDTALVTITVSGAPVANDDSYSTNHDTVLTRWWDTNWTARRQLTFDNSAQTESLADFPVLVKLNAGNIDYSQTQDNGEDLRFYDTDGTELAYDIEEWNEGGESIVWVKVPQIDGSSNSDSIWMYYGNASAGAGENPSAVWDNGYVGVWHLDEAPADGTAGGHVDSTGNGNDGTPEDVPA